jgi:hypothetical protein
MTTREAMATPRTKTTAKRTGRSVRLVSFRCHEEDYCAALERAAVEDIDLSKLFRRAVRRELAAAGLITSVCP